MDTPMKKAAEHRLLNGSDFEAEFGAPPQLDAAGSDLETNDMALEDFSRNVDAGEGKAVAEEDGDYLRVSAIDVEDAPAANEDAATEAEENAAPAAAEEENKDEEEEPTVQTIEPAKKSKRRILNIVTDWARNIGSPKVAKRATRARKGGDAGKSSGATAALAKKAIKKAAKPPKGPKKASGKGPNVSIGPRTPTRSHRTKPITPRCMKRVSRASIGKGKILSTEEREMQELKQKREEMVKRRKLSSSSFKRLSNSQCVSLADAGPRLHAVGLARFACAVRPRCSTKPRPLSLDFFPHFLLSFNAATPRSDLRNSSPSPKSSTLIPAARTRRAFLPTAARPSRSARSRRDPTSTAWCFGPSSPDALNPSAPSLSLSSSRSDLPSRPRPKRAPASPSRMSSSRLRSKLSGTSRAVSRSGPARSTVLS